MFEDIKANISDWSNEDEIEKYLLKILRKEAFDKSGLIYGIGHAVYSLSDPRANILRKLVIEIADKKGLDRECELYLKVEKLAPIVIGKERRIYKGVSSNVDFYSGLFYSMLGIPNELFTPLFAMARIIGWSAHRIEEIINQGKIIRPAYKCVIEPREYINMENR